jgi:cytochrome c-type biogenesis protein CcmH
MRGLRTAAAGLVLTAWIGGGTNAIEPVDFSAPDLEQRFRHLVQELRCTVCQNQSLADSNAELARDLRREIQVMLESGARDDEIVDFMVARYGSFVLYRPPLSPATMLLWVGPFLLAVAGAGVLYGVARASRRQAAAPLPAADRQRAARLLQAGADGKSDP